MLTKPRSTDQGQLTKVKVKAEAKVKHCADGALRSRVEKNNN